MEWDFPMHILAGMLIVIGLAAVIVALGLLLYILPHAFPFKTPGWMTILLKSYKPHIIAYFVLLAVSATALGLAAYIGNYAP
jgi:uncharacterized membrane protein YphA (DoxX/SURF4 family)